VVIDAIRWRGCDVGLTDGQDGPDEQLAEHRHILPPVTDWSEANPAAGGAAPDVPPGEVWRRGDYLFIGTLEGVHRADPGDWIIKGVKGELYPCKPDIFAQTYEPAEADVAPREALLDIHIHLTRTDLARVMAGKTVTFGALGRTVHISEVRDD